MKHYVLLKLKSGTDPVEVQEKMWKTYRKLDDELDWLNHPVVYRGCKSGDVNYDIMAVAEIDGEERLSEFLAHPLLEKLEHKVRDMTVNMVTFDHY